MLSRHLAIVLLATAAGALHGCPMTTCSDPPGADWQTRAHGLYFFCECGAAEASDLPSDTGDTGDAGDGPAVGSPMCYSADEPPPTCFLHHQFGAVDLSESPLTLENQDKDYSYSYTLTSDELAALREACAATD